MLRKGDTMKYNQSIEKLIETHRVKNVNIVHSEQLTFGQEVSDKIAEVAGSWKFIIIFFKWYMIFCYFFWIYRI